jgi:hypothetical protein
VSCKGPVEKATDGLSLKLVVRAPFPSTTAPLVVSLRAASLPPPVEIKSDGGDAGGWLTSLAAASPGGVDGGCALGGPLANIGDVTSAVAPSRGWPDRMVAEGGIATGASLKLAVRLDTPPPTGLDPPAPLSPPPPSPPTAPPLGVWSPPPVMLKRIDREGEGGVAPSRLTR